MNAKNARVLVVDDESDVLFAVRMLLKTEEGSGDGEKPGKSDVAVKQAGLRRHFPGHELQKRPEHGQ